MVEMRQMEVVMDLLIYIGGVLTRRIEVSNKYHAYSVP